MDIKMNVPMEKLIEDINRKRELLECIVEYISDKEISDKVIKESICNSAITFSNLPENMKTKERYWYLIFTIKRKNINKKEVILCY